MNKLLPLCLFCLLGFAACHSAITREKNKTGDGVTGEDGKEISMEDLDTAMIFLKTSQTISLADAFSQTWKMEDVNRHWNDFFWDSATNKRQYPELALFRDFTVTENARCKMRMGKWQLNKERSELAIHFFDGTEKTYVVRQILLKQMVAVLKRPKDTVVIRFLASGLVHKRPTEDPFHPDNNQWRIPPASSETNEQIRLRIKGCVHFYALFFKDNRQRQENDISFIGLPTCFEWYNGGIGLPAIDDLDAKWINCFYSEKQAEKGYDMLKAILGKHLLQWSEHPSSWVQQTYEVLEQMEEKL